jgi:hypothetical protein
VDCSANVAVRTTNTRNNFFMIFKF